MVGNGLLLWLWTWHFFFGLGLGLQMVLDLAFLLEKMKSPRVLSLFLDLAFGLGQHFRAGKEFFVLGKHFRVLA